MDDKSTKSSMNNTFATIKSINLKLQLIDLLIEERNRGACPFGEWPSVMLLREMKEDYLSIKEKQNG